MKSTSNVKILQILAMGVVLSGLISCANSNRVAGRVMSDPAVKESSNKDVTASKAELKTATGTAVVGATVKLYFGDKKDNVVEQVTSDKNGYFNYTVHGNHKNDAITVEATASGFQTSELAIGTREEWPYKTILFTLAPATPATELEKEAAEKKAAADKAAAEKLAKAAPAPATK